MFGRKSGCASSIISTLAVIIVIFIIGLILFSYIGLIALLIFLGIGVGIAAIYALVVYVRALITASRELGGGTNSFVGFLKNWVKLFCLASRYAFKENLTVASNALGKSRQYKFISPRHWMWFIVAPAAIIIGSLVIVGVIVLQAVIFMALAFILVMAMAVYALIAFLFACGYAMFFSVKNTVAEGLRDVFTFNFTRSATLSEFGSSVKQYFVGLCTVMASVWQQNLSIGQSNKSYASSYKIIQPQYVFLFATFMAMPIVSVLYFAIVFIIALVCFIPIALVSFIWTLIAMLISKIR